MNSVPLPAGAVATGCSLKKYKNVTPVTDPRKAAILTGSMMLGEFLYGRSGTENLTAVLYDLLQFPSTAEDPIVLSVVVGTDTALTLKVVSTDACPWGSMTVVVDRIGLDRTFDIDLSDRRATSEKLSLIRNRILFLIPVY